MSILSSWIEASRPRTLPVSLAGVLYAFGLAVMTDCFSWAPAMMCLAFALLAQIASNFANEYYDFKAGADRPGREGPRRGVTEGDITPGAMKAATFITLGLACAIGVALVYFYGRWWMYAVGVATALGVIAYSAGPFPLSRHALGELAVIIFFGIVPVTLTYCIMSGRITSGLIVDSVGIGLFGANVLIVNNYRDIEDDKAAGKHTLSTIIGRPASRALYLFNGLLAVVMTFSCWLGLPTSSWIFPFIYVCVHIRLYTLLIRLRGRALNKVLGMTAMAMFFYCGGYLIASLWH